LFFLDDANVLYPVGQHLVQYNFEKKTQRIIQVPLEGEIIGCMGYSINDASIALGVKSDNPEERRASVLLLDLHNFKRKKVFKPADSSLTKVQTTDQEFISIAFSTDGKFILAQSGAPDWMLYIWTLDKGKLVCSSKATSAGLALRKMSCNPHDVVTSICITGESLFRIFRFQDGFLKLIHQTKFEQDLKSHCWLSETRVAVGTSDGKVLIFENGDLISEMEYVAPLLNDIGSSQIKSPNIVSLAAFSSGFMAGLENGTLIQYERCDDTKLYKQKKEFQIDDGSISVIQWNVKEDRALLGFSSNQLYMLQIENSAQGEVVKYDRLAQSFHDGSILGMDACISKPLLVTSGVDRTIRIWNYLEHTLEVAGCFSEVAYSVAIHPSGLYLLACFPSCIKLLAILLSEVKPYWDYGIRSAKECKFSRGGKYFAVVSSINVVIFDTWNQEAVATLKVASARVKYVEWSKDDSSVYTFCSDGSFHQWTVPDWKKVNELTMPGLLASATLNDMQQSLYIYTKEGLVKEIAKGRVAREWSSKEPLSSSMNP
jgi:WD40 repeat protein